MKRLPRLYAIADHAFGDPVAIGRALFLGGASLVQVRARGVGSRRLLETVQILVDHAPAGSRVVVNDRPDVAFLSGAGGVHLGQEDLPPAAARRLLGPDALIGISTHTDEEARQAQDLSVDYVAAGPIFPTSTKTDARPPIGLAALASICRTSRLPVVAIGGIRLGNLGRVLETGARSVAVISDLVGTEDIEARTREYLSALGRLVPD